MHVTRHLATATTRASSACESWLARSLCGVGRAPRQALLLLLVAILSLSAALIPGTTRVVRAQATSGDWPTYLSDPGRSGFNPSETAITTTTAPNLKLRWKYATGSAIFGEPVEVGGITYFGASNGNEYAVNASGTLLWSSGVGVSKSTVCPNYGVIGAATIASITLNGTSTSAVFIGGGNRQVYALNAATGAVIWHTPIGTSTSDFIWDSPAVYQGALYIGVASLCDSPVTQGLVYQIDATTGTILHTFAVVPTGCIGAGVWGSPTVDAAGGALYVATGNQGKCASHEAYAEAVVKLSLSNLSYLDSWQVPVAQQITDGDFGSTPTLFSASINGTVRDLVGVANKNGLYYALDQSALHAGPVWTTRIANSGGSPTGGYGSISPSAWDGSTLYAAGGKTTIKGVSCGGNVGALNPATGAFKWRDCLSGPVLGAVVGVPGVIVVGAGNMMKVVAAASGATLLSYRPSTSGNFRGAASISQGVLYEGNKDGNLYAFAP